MAPLMCKALRWLSRATRASRKAAEQPQCADESASDAHGTGTEREGSAANAPGGLAPRLVYVLERRLHVATASTSGCCDKGSPAKGAAVLGVATDPK
jgi:hypothetical protein